MAARVVLPLGVLALAILLWALQIRLVAAPVIMLLVWPYWLAMGVGIALTLRFSLPIGALGAGGMTAGLLGAFDPATINGETMAMALFAPWIPLAVVQLLAAPFQARARRGVEVGLR